VTGRTPEVERFWREFCAATGTDPGTRCDVWRFGDSAALADELLELVLHGPKRATAGLLLDHELDGDPLPEVGGLSVVLDGRDRPRVVLRTTGVEVTPFRAVDAAFAWDEGEGDRTLASWTAGHEAYFRRSLDARGMAFDPDLPCVLERFTIAWTP
jgi:uncharacterized protein YhfF